LPDKISDEYLLKTINAKFYSEAKYGEKIQVYIDSDLENNTFTHTMKSNFDNKLLVAAHTKWEEMTQK
jgi:hypothetical protein